MSSLSIGIVGLPNVGKSTLFNALTKNKVLAANYPFATIEPNEGVVGVPDSRLKELGTIYPGTPIVPATVNFTDIAGLVAGASKGEGLGNQFLANIREAAAIAHVVRAFNDDNVIHVDKAATPKRDIETIHTELIVADLQAVEKRLQQTEKLTRSDPKLNSDLSVLKDIYGALDEGILITNFVQPQTVASFLQEAKIQHDTKAFISHLLTSKPIILVFNVDEISLSDTEKLQELNSLAAGKQVVYVCAKLEEELQNLNEEEAAEFLQEYGQSESGLVKLARSGYEALGLQSFFTAGEKEVRAWTIARGATAPEAAGVIHTDMERGFIAAEIVNWQDLLRSGSRSAARSAGLIRTEGKDYIMQDGDVAEFRFNV